MNILWCITGGGHMLEESCREIERLSGGNYVTVALSKAGREVVGMYGHRRRLRKAAKKVVREEEQGCSSPMVCNLGVFDLVVVSPCTANTAAKIALGIADSLVSNIVAQRLKAGKSVVLVPTDREREVETTIPSGRRVRLRCRKVDLENTKKLGKMRNVRVVGRPDKIRGIMKDVD